MIEERKVIACAKSILITDAPDFYTAFEYMLAEAYLAAVRRRDELAKELRQRENSEGR